VRTKTALLLRSWGVKGLGEKSNGGPTAGVVGRPVFVVALGVISTLPS